MIGLKYAHREFNFLRLPSLVHLTIDILTIFATAKTIERRPRNADELYELSEELAAANITYSFDRPRKLEIFNISDIEQKLDETDATIEEIQSQMRSQAAIEFGLYDDHGNDEEEDEDSNFF